jgi:PAS domain S-box-containing protein
MSSRPLSILIVEDHEDDAALVMRELKRGGLAVAPRRVETAAEMQAALAERPWDLILTDYSLPGFGAAEALALAHQVDPDVPVIVVSGTIGEDCAVDIMRAGACDYVLKESLRRLVPAVNRELREAENRRARRRSEEALRSSEARFRALIEKSFDAVLLLDAQGVILYGTSAIERISGWTLATLVGTKFSDWKHPAEVAQHAAGLRAFLEDWGASLTHEGRIRHRDGSWRWFEATFTNLLADPAVQAIVVNLRDVTYRKTAAAAVARDALLLSNVRDSVIVIDLDGIVTYWNAGASRIFGWSAEEMIGKPALQRYPEPIRSQAREMLAEMMNGKEFSGEWEDTRKDGSKIWVEARIDLLRDQEGRPVGLLGIAHDISDRKRAEADRDRLLSQLRLQIERMPLGYVLIDPQGGVLDWNPMAERIFGFPRQEVLGRKLSEVGVLTPEWVRKEAEILELARTGEVTSRWIGENRTRDGRTITCEWFSNVLTAPDGGVLGIFSLVQDITARRESEASLRLHDRAIQAVTQGILITDPNLPDNPIVFASPGFERMTGYSAAEVAGRNSRFLLGKDTEPEEVIRLRRAVQEGSPCRDIVKSCG